MLSLLPNPPSAWLESLNTRQRQAEMEPQERPIRALELWAKEHGQPGNFAELAMRHLGGPAWVDIRNFYRANTALAREEVAPMLLSCFYYDAAFWPLHIPIGYGAANIDPIRSIRETPPPVLNRLGHDNAARDQLDAHWFDCADHAAGMSSVVDRGSLANPLATNFLDGADAMLDSAAASLLSGKPNAKAAEHARFAFESALKALMAKCENLTSDDEFRKRINHHLDKQLVRCQPLLDAREYQRLDAAHPHFPAVGARYANQTIPRRQLWTCYAEARHATATVLRTLGGPDSRQKPLP